MTRTCMQLLLVMVYRNTVSLPPYGPESAVPKFSLLMEVLQCPPPDPAGDAAALVAATSPPVPTTSTAATPARSAYQPGLCPNEIPMITPCLSVVVVG